MKMAVKEVSRLCGVSVRALQYYDEIGLLCPERNQENGYRFYSEEDLSRLQQILFFRELEIPLKEIRGILSEPSFGREPVLQRQKELLILKRDHLEGLIRLVDESLKGENRMPMKEKLKAFDQSKFENARENYRQETALRYGATEAYQECERRTIEYSKEDWGKILMEAREITDGFADCAKRGAEPDDFEVQELVEAWKAYLTRSYYTCTEEVLSGLGQLYSADARFAENLDRSGTGTAELMSRAIAVRTAGLK